jgi:hypothetical protein
MTKLCQTFLDALGKFLRFHIRSSSECFIFVVATKKVYAVKLTKLTVFKMIVTVEETHSSCQKKKTADLHPQTCSAHNLSSLRRGKWT